jgi:hypothetical protein
MGTFNATATLRADNAKSEMAGLFDAFPDGKGIRPAIIGFLPILSGPPAHPVAAIVAADPP